ncbi:MAG: alginate export family protein [Nitrospirales bacterium]|nr:alginate export family protein [Nitrospira sp.]MDR4500308.1 alginate export family protein [Nitrospirales bacterium]
MRDFHRFSKWFTAACLIVTMSAVPVFAQKTTPATDQNTNVPAVPRAIPDLLPYQNFDPPQSKAFDFKNLTISGDMRVRPEFRTNAGFGTNAVGAAQKNNQYFTQQLIRLGFNYDVSPDVVFFVQAQVSNNFGTGNPNSSGNNLFLRQGYMLIRNFLTKNLTLKAGRQLVVWGNHRIFGHFDWNNVGFTFDGVTLRYNHGVVPVELGWLQVGEGNCTQNAGACGLNPNGGNAYGGDANILFVRLPMNIAGTAIEPAWIYEDGGIGAGPGGNGANLQPLGGGQQSNQERHTLGARIATKQGIVDATVEGYYQVGKVGAVGGATNRDIRAYAVHADAGVTLPVPMQPRIGAEFNYGSGDDDPTDGKQETFSQLFPTNHIHFGYMDLMSWQNMMTFGGNLQLRPTKNSHFEIAGHYMRLANEDDNWYGANQSIFKQTPAGNNEKSLGGEIDVVYTLFFQDNKVGWQLGYGHFFTGDYNKKNGFGTADQNWGYTQLWINF